MIWYLHTLRNDHHSLAWLCIWTADLIPHNTWNPEQTFPAASTSRLQCQQVYHMGGREACGESVPERNDWSYEFLQTKPPLFFFLNYYHDCGVSKYLDVSTTLFECNGCSVNLHSTHWFVQKFSNYLKCGPGLTSKIIISLKVYGIYISITWYIHSAPISPPHRFKFLAK